MFYNVAYWSATIADRPIFVSIMYAVGKRFSILSSGVPAGKA